MDEKKYSVEETFRAGVAIIHSLPKEGPIKASISEKLKFYSLYKQATEGPCNIPKPGFWNVIESYKWNGWKSLGDMSQKEAMEKYIAGMLRKMDQVAEVYDTSKWMQEATEKAPEKLEEMRHNFDVIGRPFSLYSQSKDSDENEDSEQRTIQEEEKENEQIEDEKKETSDSPTLMLSDAEYCDAEDTLVSNEETHISLIANGGLGSNGNRRRRPSSPKNNDALRAIRAEIGQLANQVSRLAQQIENRYKTFNGLLQQLTKNQMRERKRPYRWWIVLLFVWPILLHYLMKYRHLIKFLPQLLWYRLTS